VAFTKIDKSQPKRLLSNNLGGTGEPKNMGKIAPIKSKIKRQLTWNTEESKSDTPYNLTPRAATGKGITFHH